MEPIRALRVVSTSPGEAGGGRSAAVGGGAGRTNPEVFPLDMVVGSATGADPALRQAVQAEATRDSFARLVEEYLGAALRYEHRYGLPLIETLGAYFEQNGNVAATARVLGLNRQSLLYRLDRFEVLTGVDLTSPADRFALELALRCLPMRQARPWVTPTDRDNVMGAR